MTLQSRRHFVTTLSTVAAGALGLGPGRAADPPAAAPSSPSVPVVPDGMIDFHVHLFGVGDGKTGCRFSPVQRRHPNYRYLLNLLGLSENGRMDQDYVDRLVATVRGSEVKRALVQAWDCRYDDQGRPDWERTTSLYVPNEYLFEVVGRHSDVLLPCASINPQRRDWREEVDRCAERGARAVKVHPPTMDVDPADPRYRPFYRHCALRRMVLMFHTGAEHSADIAREEVCDVARLTGALEEGCTVVAAHAGMGAFFDRADYFPALVELVRRHPRLYFDNSVLGSMFRWRTLPRILDTPEILERAVHGSDFPFPTNAAVYWNQLSPATLTELLEERNLVQRDYRLKRALGMPAEVFSRGMKILKG